MTDAHPRNTIATDQFLAHPPARVWQALTDADLMARWLMPNDFEPRVGHAFTYDTGQWGLTSCEVLELQPERLLRISWRNGSLDTTVTWRLEAEGSGTRLFLEHTGFDLDDPFQAAGFEGMGEGWRTELPRRLTSVLDDLAAAP